MLTKMSTISGADYTLIRIPPKPGQGQCRYIRLKENDITPQPATMRDWDRARRHKPITEMTVAILGYEQIQAGTEDTGLEEKNI